MKFDNKNKQTGIKRVISAFINTCKGFYWLCRNEAAFKQELILTIALIIVSLFLNISAVERVILIISLLLILLTETLNTAVEAVVDRIGLEFHELSGLAKDLGSAAVFISFMVAVVAWVGILCF